MEARENEVYERVCNVLGFRGNVGFLENEADATNIKQKLILQEAKDKMGIDAVYFIQTALNSLPVPVIYFKKLKTIDTTELRKLHKRIWNQGRTPLLFVISPTEIILYNCFEPPPKTLLEDLDAGKRLIRKLTMVANEEEIRQSLGEFSREKIDIGSFLSTENRFNAENRADQHLLRNLRFCRRELISKGLNYKHVHSLMGRSIFILFLEDRGALVDFFNNFHEDKQYKKFTDVLPNEEDTYELFSCISRHFNGDMFPVTDDERNSVNVIHLSKLKAFLRGRDPDGQERLWPYSFDVIPIEFISSIYMRNSYILRIINLRRKEKTTALPIIPLCFLLNFF